MTFALRLVCDFWCTFVLWDYCCPVDFVLLVFGTRRFGLCATTVFVVGL